MSCPAETVDCQHPLQTLRGFPKRSPAGGVAFPFYAWHIFWERGTQTLGVGGWSGLNEGHSLAPSAPQRREAECMVSVEASWGPGELPGTPRASLWTNSEEWLG